MNILCLLGSARADGNSATLAGHFLNKAREYKSQIKIFHLYSMDFKGCAACWKCQQESERCVINDDLTRVFEAMADADLLLLASPIYFGDVSSSMKAFIERTYWCYNAYTQKNRLKPGIKLVFILSQGADKKYCDPYCHDIFTKYNKYLNLYGFDPGYEIRLYGVNNPGDLEVQGKKIRQTRELATRLCNPCGEQKT